MNHLINNYKTIQQEKFRTALVHILVILIFPIVTLFVLPFDEEWAKRVYLFLIFFYFSSCLLFYFNFIFLIKKYLKKKKIWTFVLANLFFSFLMCFIIRTIMLNMTISFSSVFLSESYLSFFLRTVPFSVVFVLLAIAIRMTNDWFRTEQERTKILAEASQAELNNLKNQINPHFLFNTLNNIYALIGINSDKAQKAVLELSKLLRYTIYDNNDNTILLNKELRFTQNYIELMSLRLTDKVDLKVNIPEVSSSLTIAPLMFITLIENAFKHGVSQNEKSFININIIVKDKTVQCEVKNSNFPKKINDYSGSGIGINNLKRRLELIYPQKHKYEIDITDNIYTAFLEIQLDEYDS